MTINILFPNLGTQARQVTAVKGDGLNSDYHPRVISATGSADGGNKNKTLGQKITEFFHDHEWVSRELTHMIDCMSESEDCGR